MSNTVFESRIWKSKLNKLSLAIFRTRCESCNLKCQYSLFNASRDFLRNTGLPAYSHTDYSYTLAIVTAFLSKIGSPRTLKYQLERDSFGCSQGCHCEQAALYYKVSYSQ